MSGEEDKKDSVGAEHGDGAVAGPSGLGRRRDSDSNAGPQSPRRAQTSNVDRENESAESRDSLPSYGEPDHDNFFLQFRERPWENVLLTAEHNSSSSSESDTVMSVPLPGPHAQPGPSRDQHSLDRRPPRLGFWTVSSPVRPDYARYLFSYINQYRNGIVHRNMATYMSGANAEYVRRQLSMLPRTPEFEGADEWPQRQHQDEQPREERAPEPPGVESGASPHVTRDRLGRRHRSEDRELVRDRSRHRERRLSESPDGRAADQGW